MISPQALMISPQALTISPQALTVVLILTAQSVGLR